jgi:hypothetical protein
MKARRIIHMKTYEMITLEQATQRSFDCLVKDYNDAIETIWHLQHELLKQQLETAQLLNDYSGAL